MSFTDLSPLSSHAAFHRQCGPSVGRPVCRAPVRPPRGFKSIRGAVSNVRFGGSVPANKGHTAAQKAGLHYEQRVHDVLAAIYGIDYRPNAAILYEDRSGLRRAIPDGILKIGDCLVIVEIKLTHTERAWWQLTRLYVPLLAILVAPGTRIYTVEICRSYDVAVNFPQPHVLVESLHQLPPNAVGVLRWKI